MAKKWYPVIDYLTCIECGICIAECPNDVYDKSKAPVPVVKNPDACCDQCHGCSNRCPVEAIKYVGDNPSNKLPNINLTLDKASCGCDVDARKIIVEYLYLDLDTCERCIKTDDILDEVMMTLDPALKTAGFEVEYNKIAIETAELAKKYKFLASPTIRVNGQDVCQSVDENNCGCCSDISGTDINCRVFEYDQQSYEVPPKEILAETIFNIIFNKIEPSCSCSSYELPENLKIFFEGKKNKANCSCGGDC